jgi:hypothetical protein
MGYRGVNYGLNGLLVNINVRGVDSYTDV